MPNWCENTLTITGDEKIVKKVMDWWKEHESEKTKKGLFDTFYPMPKELEDTTSPNSKNDEILVEKFGANNWYDWRLNNWGVKWDTNEVFISHRNETDIVLSFDTPWGPPIVFYEKLIRDYSDIHIKASYYEGGMDFCGTWDSDFGEEDFSISDIKAKCLEIYKKTHKDNVDGFEFRERLENIYETNFSISEDIDVYEIFDDYYFEENLNDAEFCKEYNIKKENQ